MNSPWPERAVENMNLVAMAQRCFLRFFTRALCPPVGPVTDPWHAHLHAARTSGDGSQGDRQVSGRASCGPCPTRAGKEKAVDLTTWVGGDEEGGRRKDGRPWRSSPEVTEVSPAPCILPCEPPSPFLRLLPAVAAAAAPEPRLPPALDNAMADAGRSLHPSARGRGRTERRALRLLRLLLWVGTAFQVIQGAEPELHACKEVLSSPNRPHFGQKNRGSRRRPWGLRHGQFQRPWSLGFFGDGAGGGWRGADWSHGEASPLEDSQFGQLSSGRRVPPSGTWVPGLWKKGRRHGFLSSWDEITLKVFENKRLYMYRGVK